MKSAFFNKLFPGDRWLWTKHYPLQDIKQLINDAPQEQIDYVVHDDGVHKGKSPLWVMLASCDLGNDAQYEAFETLLNRSNEVAINVLAKDSYGFDKSVLSMILYPSSYNPVKHAKIIAKMLEKDVNVKEEQDLAKVFTFYQDALSILVSDLMANHLKKQQIMDILESRYKDVTFFMDNLSKLCLKYPQGATDDYCENPMAEFFYNKMVFFAVCIRDILKEHIPTEGLEPHHLEIIDGLNKKVNAVIDTEKASALISGNIHKPYRALVMQQERTLDRDLKPSRIAATPQPR